MAGIILAVGVAPVLAAASSMSAIITLIILVPMASDILVLAL